MWNFDFCYWGEVWKTAVWLQRAWADGAGGTRSPSSLCRLVSRLLWHVAGNADFPVWFLREFSKITAWPELWHPWPHGAVVWGRRPCVSWYKHSSGTDLRFLFALLGSRTSPPLRTNRLFFCISYSGIMYKIELLENIWNLGIYHLDFYRT